MDFTVGIVSRKLATTSNFVKFRDIRNLHVFQGTEIWCRKTTCDVKKVTYNMYSCDTCYEIKEMMEMDNRDSAKCQNPREGTWMTLFES